MTPLSIQCETCQTRLRVRDEGFIGQVHACPKCGSMVLIGPPPQQPAAAETSAQPAEAGTTETGPTEAGSTEQTTADQPASMTLALSNTLVENVEPPSVATPPTDVAPTETAPPEEAAPSETNPAPTEVTEAAEAAVARSPIGVAPAAATGLALLGAATLGVMWLISIPGGPAPVVASATAEEAAPTEPDEPPPAQTEPTEPTEPTETPVDAPPILADDPVTPHEAADAPPAPNEPPVALPTAADLPVEEPVSASGTPAVSPEPAAPPVVEETTPIDPLEFDPDTIDLVLRGPDAAPREPAAEGAPANTETPRTALLDRPAVDLDSRLADAARHGAVTVRRGPTGDPATAPPSEPADRLLAVVVPEIDLENVPLADAIELFGSLSGSPVTLEPAALWMAGLDPTRELTIRGEGLTLGELLDETLGGVRLGYRTEGPHVLISRPDADSARSADHRLTDLATSLATENGADLGTLLQRIGPAEVGDAPLTGGVLSLDAPRRAHYELLLLCERLRVARGLALESRYPRRLLRTTPALAGLAPVLDRRTTFSFIRPTALADVVEHWRRATGLTVLVDWRSLGEAGLGPRSTIEGSVTNRPWAEALDGFLGPLGLGWAPLDDRTLWITSLPRLESTPLTEFYPAAPAEGRAAAERLAAERPTAGVVYDPAGRTLLVRGDAQAQRAAWRSVSEAPSSP